jgi:cytochrome c
MKPMILGIAVAIMTVWSGLTALAGERATPDEAKAMAEKAATLLKADGPEKAFPAFNDQKGAFQDRDLYVFVQNREGVNVAFGGNPAMLGKNVMNLKDVEGKSFIKEMQALKDAGWVEYKWVNPQTKAVETKASYVVWVGDYLVGVGAYKN